MQIKLKSLKITNFKGIQSFQANFNHITNIYGDNATGKTTIFDAFLWLFFGKNSEEKSKFEIKRLDENNRFIERLETEVEAIIHVNDVEIAVRKNLRQKWVKKRGELKENYEGDENVYFWNDVPCKESEFKEKIKAIIDEALFKLITNPFYFNSLPWNDRRNILVGLAGEISSAGILETITPNCSKVQIDALTKALNEKKTIVEYRKELAVKRRKVKEEFDLLPSRMDEVKRGTPAKLDFDSIREEIATYNKHIQCLQDQLNDEVAKQQAESKRQADAMREHNSKVQAKQQKSFDLKTKIQNIEFEAKQHAKESGGKIDAEINSLNRQISELVMDRDRYTKQVENLQKDLLAKETRLEELRDQFELVDEEQMEPFDDHSFTCPTCKQNLPETDIEVKKQELAANFNKNKAAKLDAITLQGTDLKGEVEALKARITNGNTAIAECSSNITSLTIQVNKLQKDNADRPSEELLKQRYLASHKEYQSLLSQLKENESAEITAPVFDPVQQNDQLKAEINIHYEKVMELQKQLALEETITKAENRLKELMGSQETMAQEIAELEGIDFACTLFTKAKIEEMEQRINGRFKFVKFKMFTQQVNGGEAETCETLVNTNGSFVPFNDANNAAKINSGIDIINTLSMHYNVYAPVFIDNRESITRLIDSDSQIVNLFVSEIDKKLRVA